MSAFASLLLLFLLSAFSMAPADAAPDQTWLLRRIHLSTPEIVWAMGESGRGLALFRSTDGERRWDDVTPEGFFHSGEDREEEAEDADFYALSGGTAWAALEEADGRVRVERTGDGGRHWQRATFPVREEFEGGGVTLQFLNPSVGFLLLMGSPAAGLMPKATYRTRDGGRTWEQTSSDAASAGPRHQQEKALPYGGFYPTGLTFRDSLHGWVTASNHGDPDVPLYRTSDGGWTWRLQTLRLPPRYAGFGANTYPPVFFGPGKRDGMLPMKVFHDRAKGFLVYVTHDGGRHWQGRDGWDVPEAEAKGCFFVDAEHGWVTGARERLYATHDGGGHWSPSGPRPPFGPGAEEVTLDFLTPQLGWALTGKTDGGTSGRSSALWRTQDGGRHWEAVSAGGLPGRPRRHPLLKKRRAVPVGPG